MLAARQIAGQKARLGAVSRVSGISRPAIARVHRRAERKAITVKAIFNLFAPKADAPSSAKTAELVEELLTVVSSGRAPAQTVADLVQELQPLSTKNPVRSKLLFGKYKLLYSSRPVSGNPLQILEEPDAIREVSEIKSLGLLPGTSTQSGELNGLSNDTYEESFTRLEVKSPLGTDSRDVDVTRIVTVLYLDRDLRIVRTKGENESGEGTLAVYERVAEDDDEDQEEAAPRAIGGFFGGSKESTATIAERQVRKKMAAEQEAKGGRAAPPTPAAAVASRVGTVKVGATRTVAPPAPTPVRGGTVKVDAKAKADAAQKAKEEAIRAKEAAAAKERAEAEKRAAVERNAAIKALLEALGTELKEAQINTREAVKEARDLEKSNAAVLKQVAAARSQVRNASEDVSEVEESLTKAVQARGAAEAALKEALAEVNAAQNRVKAATTRK